MIFLHPKMKIGVLSLQGDFKEHIEILKKCSVDAVLVRLPQDLKDIDGLIIPGGESTTIGNLMLRHNLDKEIIRRHKEGMAVYGTCAGAILIANDVIASKQPRLNLIDISVKRNHYGRQIDSFEASLKIKGISNFRGIFIRAPLIEKVGKGVMVLSKFQNKPVLIKKDNILASTFHPELTGDKRVHEYFINMIENFEKINFSMKCGGF